MCGRFATTITDREMRSMFDVDEAEVVGEELPASYNVAPTQPMRMVLERPPADEEGEPVRQVRTARWGLVPSWAKDRSIGNKLINARSETVTTKPSFRSAARSRRAVIPADGYYEWEKRDGRKVPHFLHPGDGALAMAGLYEMWRDPDKSDDDPDRWLWTATILTRPATDELGRIHDRCPLVLPPEFHGPWLDRGLDVREDVEALIRSVPDPRLDAYEVSTAVNSPRNNSPDLLSPV
ncbi:SOS response-associated peptidase [Tomitella fengzijianii]|uniref:Abasic site processing protein n=1 Tax=Tomitella fengzijianii TaxID=2597660 RepID=A0A516X1X7_9ACTN|nr:SOS response-associated peptidase [Tomitella fengzijianii]QDQ97096.1 SOS response-associated peptidase [Tomitella fengzijianii]